MSAALSREFESRIRRDEPMARHTSWHVGGPADLYFEPRDRADLAAFLRQLSPQLPIHFLGLGSNLLVRDGGLRGVVIATQTALRLLERRSQEEVYCEAGVPCAQLARQCQRWQLGPAEFFAGIPGTMGGALAMNAGAFGGETWRHVQGVETIDRDGVIHERAVDEFTIGYRSVRPRHADEWFIAARLGFSPRRGAGDAEIRALLSRRRETQPIGAWSCGSVFTNPPGDHAARLIDSAGLKGLRIGGASVSAKHANFIINDGQATATDIEALIHEVQARVLHVHGVQLVPEVHIAGERR
ncbi:MAG: UDP-N-acetylmuramate dehydrogenase [Steroidobacteraceae bacterium]